MKSPRSLLTLFAMLALAFSFVAAARADETYDVSGRDVYQIGPTQNTSIDYTGTQRLAVHLHGEGRLYVATARYIRTDKDDRTLLHARFVQEMARDGSLDDESDDDPDFLTILNQPFAIQLDSQTMVDLRSLHSAVPFEATSPLGGARLTGTLRPAVAGIVHGRAVVGVHFSAAGAMSGTLPQTAGAQLEGTIHMDGTAYYSDRQALLLALDATLTIDGTLTSKNATVPVRIVYHRIIRAGNTNDAPSIGNR